MSDIVMPNEVVLRMKLLRVYSVFVRQLSGYALYELFRECEAKICGETVSAGCGVLAGWIKAVPLTVYDYYPNLSWLADVSGRTAVSLRSSAFNCGWSAGACRCSE